MCQVVAPSWIRTEVIGLHDGVDMSLKCNRTVCVGVRSSETDRRVVRNHNSKTVSRVNEKSFVSSVFFRFHLNFYWFSRSHALSHSTISARKWIDKREKKTIINNHLISKRFDKNSTGKWWFATETFQLNVFIFLRHRAIKTHSFCLLFKRMCLGLGQITPSHSYIHVRFSLFDKLNALHFNSFIRDSNRIHMRCHVNETEVLYLKHLSASPSNARAAAAAADTSLHRDCVNTRSHVSISSYQQSSHIHLEHTRFGSPKWFGTRARARTHTKWKTIFENEKKSIAGDKQPPKHRHFAMETVNHEK